MAHVVHIAKRAVKDIERLPRRDQERVWAAIEALEDEPRPHGSKKLRGHESTYRVRVGDYRVVYEVYDARVEIIVVKVGHRKDIYD